MTSKTSVILLLVFSLSLVWAQNETPATNTAAPSSAPTEAPSSAPTEAPSSAPTEAPSSTPSSATDSTAQSTNTAAPSSAPTEAPSTPSSATDSTAQSSSETTSPTEPTTNPSTTDSPTTVTPPFSCSSHLGTALDLAAISGVWYDVARSPDIESSQCMRYRLPASPKEDKLEVQLEYVDTSDDKWDHAEDSISLPWDDEGKNGIFTVSIGQSSPSVTLKVIGVESQWHILLCGYTNISPVQLFKVLTRESELSSEQKDSIQQLFQELGSTSEVKWVEQSALKCNSAARTAGGFLVALALLLLICRQKL